MNVSCSNCPAKYAIPDAKIRGKKVRLSCRRCGSAIVVDGTHLDDSASDDTSPSPLEGSGADAPPGTGPEAHSASSHSPKEGNVASVGPAADGLAAGTVSSGAQEAVGSKDAEASKIASPQAASEGAPAVALGEKAEPEPRASTSTTTPGSVPPPRGPAPLSTAGLARAGSQFLSSQTPRRNHPAKRTMMGGLEAPTQPLSAARLGMPQVKVSSKAATEATTEAPGVNEAEGWDSPDAPNESPMGGDRKGVVPTAAAGTIADSASGSSTAGPSTVPPPGSEKSPTLPPVGATSAEAPSPTGPVSGSEDAPATVTSSGSEEEKTASAPSADLKGSDRPAAELGASKPDEAPGATVDSTSVTPKPGDVAIASPSAEGLGVNTPDATSNDDPIVERGIRSSPSASTRETSKPEAASKPNAASKPEAASKPNAASKPEAASKPDASAHGSSKGATGGPVQLARIKPVRIGAPISPRPRPPVPKLGDKELVGWVVAINDRDHTEMSTRQVVELYAIGAVTARTLIWGKGLERWLTPFEIEEVSEALGERGFRKPTPRDSVPVSAPDASSLPDEPAPEAVSEPPESEPKGWREPGKVVPDRNAAKKGPPPRAARRTEPDPDDEVNFDEVTVAVDARKLLQQADVNIRPNLPSYDDHDTPSPGGVDGDRVSAPNDPSESEDYLRSGPDEPTVHVKDQRDIERLVRGGQPRPNADQSPDSLAYERGTTGDMLAGLSGARGGRTETTRGLGGVERSQETSKRKAAPARPPVAPIADPPRGLAGKVVMVLLLVVLVPLAVVAGIYAYDPALLARTVPALKDAFPHYFPQETSPNSEGAPPNGALLSPTAELPSPAELANSEASGAPPAAQASNLPNGSAPAAEAPSGQSNPGNAFDRKAAAVALGVAAGGTKVCWVEADAGSVVGTVTVTFEPSTGRVSTVDVSGGLRGTKTGLCVADTFRKARVNPFEGTAMVMARQVTLP